MNEAAWRRRIREAVSECAVIVKGANGSEKYSVELRAVFAER